MLPLDRDYEGHDISLEVEDNGDSAKSRNSIAPNIFFEERQVFRDFNKIKIKFKLPSPPRFEKSSPCRGIRSCDIVVVDLIILIEV